MRTIVRIICSMLEKYFWNLVRIRNPNAARSPVGAIEIASLITFCHHVAKVGWKARDSCSLESVCHRVMIYAVGQTTRMLVRWFYVASGGFMPVSDARKRLPGTNRLAARMGSCVHNR